MGGFADECSQYALKHCARFLMSRPLRLTVYNVYGPSASLQTAQSYPIYTKIPLSFLPFSILHLYYLFPPLIFIFWVYTMAKCQIIFLCYIFYISIYFVNDNIDFFFYIFYTFIGETFARWNTSQNTYSCIYSDIHVHYIVDIYYICLYM